MKFTEMNLRLKHTKPKSSLIRK